MSAVAAQHDAHVVTARLWYVVELLKLDPAYLTDWQRHENAAAFDIFDLSRLIFDYRVITAHADWPCWLSEAGL